MPDETAEPIDIARWIDAHRAEIDGGTAGPVLDDELRVLVVIGRGPRLDYHVNTVAELFYQLEGDIGVLVRDGDTVSEVTVRTGEVWLAPAGVPHGPQRPSGTVGLVVERARPAGSTESFRWYCDTCGSIVHEIVMDRVDPAEVRRRIGAFYADAEARTCGTCGTIIHKP